MVLILALLLPRPSTPYSLAGVVTRLSSRSEGDESSDKSLDQNSEDDSASQDNAASDQKGSAGENKPSRQKAPGGSTGGGEPTTSGQPLRIPGTSFLKWLPYLFAALLIAFALYRFSPEIRAGLAALRAWLTGLRRPKAKRLTKAGRSAKGTASEIRLFSDPFQTGQAARMTLAELVCYTFDGLRVWAQARGFKANPSETPLEFAERLSEHEPALTHELRRLSSYYSHVAYANQGPPEESVTVLKSLWLIIGFGKGRKA
jgi:hypothetical protein